MEVIDALDKSSFSEADGERIQENQLRREMRKVEKRALLKSLERKALGC